MLLISYLFSSCILVNKWGKSSRNAEVQTDKVPAPDSATETYDVGVQTGNGTTEVSCNGFSLSQIKEILEDDESNNKKDPGRSLLSEKAQKNIATLRSTHVDLASNLRHVYSQYLSLKDTHPQAPAPDSAIATCSVQVQTGIEVSCNGFSLSELTKILEDDESNNQEDPGLNLYSQKAQENIERLRSTHVDLASNLNELGWKYSSFENYHQAIKYLEQALAIYQSLDGETADSQLEKSILEGLGTAYSGVENLQKSTSYFEEAQKMNKAQLSKTKDANIS